LDKLGNAKDYHQGNSRLLVDLLRLITSFPDRNNNWKKNQVIKKRRKGAKKIVITISNLNERLSLSETSKSDKEINYLLYRLNFSKECRSHKFMSGQ